MSKEGAVRVPLLYWKQILNIKEINCNACQTDITVEYLTETLEKAERLTKEYASLKEQLKMNSLYQDSFEENNERVLFYNGLPNWTLVLYVFNFKDLMQSSKRVQLIAYFEIFLERPLNPLARANIFFVKASQYC